MKIKKLLRNHSNVLIMLFLFGIITLMSTSGYCSGNDEVQEKMKSIFVWIQEIAYIIAAILAIFSCLKLAATKDWSAVTAPFAAAIGIGAIGMLMKFIQKMFASSGF